MNNNKTINIMYTGIVDVFRLPAGMGIRLDDGPGFAHVSFVKCVFLTLVFHLINCLKIHFII